MVATMRVRMSGDDENDDGEDVDDGDDDDDDDDDEDNDGDDDQDGGLSVSPPDTLWPGVLRIETC